MDIVMRPRGGGKTYELVRFLVQEPDAILICADAASKDHIKRVVHEVLHEVYSDEIRPAGVNPRRVLSNDVDNVMERVIPAKQARRIKGHVLVDGIEAVLQQLLGFGVDMGTMDMPRRAGVEFDISFHDERIADAWAREISYREERRAHYRAADINFGARFGAGTLHMVEVAGGLANNPNVASTAANRERCLSGCHRNDSHLAPADCSGTMVDLL